ncbi:MAG TPA: hypothetical protein VD969_29095 [Symbiobacteriaceae bacterium]|nr:hypothetical protein [Symbiobacteriaceae bacterium]
MLLYLAERPGLYRSRVSRIHLYPGDGWAGWSLRLLAMSDAAGGLWAPAAEWESVTPFVLSRFPKQY